jgi:hypothetical protein
MLRQTQFPKRSGLSLAILAVVICALGSEPAYARQPIVDSAILGTWNQVGNNGGVIKIVITGGNGVIDIHPYGACSPSPCDWGVSPALVFSSGAGSDVAQGFEAKVSFGFKTVYLQGHLIRTSTGQVLLQVTIQNQFAPRDFRWDYQQTANYARQ